jgi:hypothetical protein
MFVRHRVSVFGDEANGPNHQTAKRPYRGQQVFGESPKLPPFGRLS